MWSRQFLIVGLASAVGIAAATLVLLWTSIFLLMLQSAPPVRFANITLLGSTGILAYPACWYALIFRRRDYAASRVVLLVAATYALSCLLAAIGLESLGLYWASLSATPVPPFFASRLVVLGAILLAVPYTVVAAPAAFLHRRGLLQRFSAASDEPKAT
jgi:hypothetical protein